MIILPTIFALALLGAFALRGRRKMGAVVLALIICFLASWPPAGWVALRTLEWRYSPQKPPAQKPTDAIVVLGGYLQRNDWGGAPTIGADTYERLVYAAALHEHWPQVPIVVSGGRALGEEHPPLAQMMAEYLREREVPDALIIQESKARNTYENAKFSMALLPSGASVAIITEGPHMWRAELVFQKQGADVIPAPCCFSSIIDDQDWGFLVPNWWTVKSMEGVLHEWLGLLVYAWRGWI
jgi:uncharacterized SAM-binding protein YcdF (DUF218 family)